MQLPYTQKYLTFQTTRIIKTFAALAITSALFGCSGADTPLDSNSSNSAMQSSSSLAISSAAVSSTTVSSAAINSSINSSTASSAATVAGLHTVSGFAAAQGMGLDTTTGGKGGEVVTVTNGNEFAEAMEGSDDPLIILVDGTMDLGGSHVSMRSNKTVIGLGNAVFTNGGFEFYGDSNIIIRNVTFENGQIDDALKINQESHHLWIDHVTLSNYEDGLLDITRGSSYITVSWSHFKNHDKALLIGHSNGFALDAGRLKTTLHHNWFDSTGQRHPRVRQGEVHIYNNLYDNINANNPYGTSDGYGIASADNAKVLVENNIFNNVFLPIQSGVPGFSGPGDIIERGNVYIDSGAPVSAGTSFEASIYYSYVLDSTDNLEAIIRMQAGAGIIDPWEAIDAAK